MGIHPDILLNVGVCNIVADDRFIENPPGMWTIKMAELKDDSSGEYSRIKPIAFDQLAPTGRAISPNLARRCGQAQFWQGVGYRLAMHLIDRLSLRALLRAPRSG